MSEPDKTSIVARFAGGDHVFRLRIGEIGELETHCGAGIGAIYTRMAALQFRLADIRQTIRLGLIGGGMPAGQADYFVGRYVDDAPINDYADLAFRVLRALFDGAEQAAREHPPGKPTGESAGPATSPPSSPQGTSPASDQPT